MCIIDFHIIYKKIVAFKYLIWVKSSNYIQYLFHTTDGATLQKLSKSIENFPIKQNVFLSYWTH